MLECDYFDFKDALIDDLKLTNKDNSILITFSIEENFCSITSLKIDRDGNKTSLRSKEFLYNKQFKNSLLEPFLKDYVENCNVVSYDITDDSCDKAVCRIINDTNDMLVIENISLEYVNNLYESVFYGI